MCWKLARIVLDGRWEKIFSIEETSVIGSETKWIVEKSEKLEFFKE